MFTNPAITITVTGGSFEDNTQICNLVHNALRNQGMTNVTAEDSIASYIDESPEMTAALRRLTPDLIDIPVVIDGECENDVQNQAIMMGLSFPDLSNFQGSADFSGFAPVHSPLARMF